MLARVCRLFIGGILLASALGKSLDLAGFVDVLITYRAIPESLLWPVALTITGLEWLLGVWVLSGWRLATGAFAVLVLYLIYTIWMTITLVRGLDLPNCGCYGVFFPQPLQWYSPVEDAIVAGMCYALWKSASRTSAPH
ncbi:MAG: MauE/DoxX family redox-associated membrane protein [Nitrospiraceae bacterium]